MGINFCNLSFIVIFSFLLAKWAQEAEPACYFLLSQMTAGLKCIVMTRYDFSHKFLVIEVFKTNTDI
jgi:hypothetical protein